MATETPSGIANGVNTTFTASSGIATNHQLFVDRVLQVLGTDYTISGVTITFLSGAIPQTDALIILYNGTAPAFTTSNVGTTTLGEMVLAAKQRADMENSEFLSDSEWVRNVNASCQHLYEKLIEAYGNDYQVADEYEFTTDGTSDAFALPGDFFKLLGVDLYVSGRWVTVWKFNFAQRNQVSFMLPVIRGTYGRAGLSYRLRGGYILFNSIPQASQGMRLWYAPRFIPLVADGDAFDGVNGWEEWIVNDAAMKARVKEESPIDGIQVLQAIQNDRLASIIENRDAGAPATTVDVYAANGSGMDEWGLC